MVRFRGGFCWIWEALGTKSRLRSDGGGNAGDGGGAEGGGGDGGGKDAKIGVKGDAGRRSGEVRVVYMTLKGGTSTLGATGRDA